mmetsp:Transcript_32744/g.55209  ORF Transcript_32744/g.55209 Transcript_32744/m.55209 type:complete len:317 (+) Transcript_32744:99-1049(+)
MNDFDSPSTKEKFTTPISKKDEDIDADFEDDEFFKKWSGPLFIGPFLPAIFAMLVIFTGELVLDSWEGTCNINLPSFINAAVAICYIYLVVFSWVYVGTEIKLVIPSLDIDMVLLRPIQSLKFVVLLYTIVAVTSFIIWIVGSILLQLAIFCVDTSPDLYNYVRFLVVTYWLGFCITFLFVIKMFFGTNIAAMIKESTRASTIDEVEEKIFRSKFSAYDPEKEGKIPVDKIPDLLEDLGVYVPPEEQDDLIQTLDEEDTGYIDFRPLLDWFRNLNAELDGAEHDVDDDDEDAFDDDDKEAANMFAESSKKGGSSKK